MKKVKKLVLCRETLRSLESPVLVKAGGEAAGGKTQFTQPDWTCDTCECTFSCPYLCQESRVVSCLCV